MPFGDPLANVESLAVDREVPVVRLGFDDPVERLVKAAVSERRQDAQRQRVFASGEGFAVRVIERRRRGWAMT